MERREPPHPLKKTVALVGLMGAGKTAVGKRLAKTLGAPFRDADDEIEEAAGLSIAEIFEVYGENAFRDLERRVVARLVSGTPMILALGGGAFMDPGTRALLKKDATTIWLRADLQTLVDRTQRRRGLRPLLMQDDPAVVLETLMAKRSPIYAEADHVVDTGKDRLEVVVMTICNLEALRVTDA